jgi:PAS domain S-box-containing protein
MSNREPATTAFDEQAPGDSQPARPGRGGADPLARQRLVLSQRLFGAGVVICVLSAMLAVIVPPGFGSETLRSVLWLTLGCAAVFLVAVLLPPRFLGLATVAAISTSVGLVAQGAAVLGWGLGTPGIGFLALVICITAAVGSTRMTWFTAALSLVALLWLAHSERQAGVTLWGGEGSLAGRLGLALLMLASAVAAGRIIARMVNSHARKAAEREDRFRSLLAVAADAYWEIDRANKLVELRVQREGGTTLSARRAVGAVPWEEPSLRLEPAVHDQLLADLQARVPFQNVSAQWLTAHNQILHFAVSGEPRFDRTGKFAGYWGVARDVTAEVQSAAQLRATEGRFDELFTRIPNPLLLHRRGLIVDANPAALRLLGEGRSDAVIGHSLLEFVRGGEWRETARRRVERLEELPVGESLAVADLQLVSLSGQRVLVRSTGVRVMLGDAPATLSIWVDDTERRAAEDVVRRSETMLQYLVATSPDVITLTDLATGRYVMVNQTFEQLTGWSSFEVIGKTAADIGIWRSAQQREDFVAAVRRDGSVKDLQVDFVTRGGMIASMLVSAAPFKMDQRDYLVINARDISAAERERLEREAILETASVGIAVTRDQRFVHVNPKFEQIYGWPAGSMAGQSGRVVWTDEESYARAGAEIGPRLARGEVVDMEYQAPRRDGSLFSAHILANPIDPARPREGGTVWIVEDVTQKRRDAEALAKARDEAEAANRAKSAFLANTSHEIRTPLNGMIGLARLARDPALDDEHRTQYLDQLAESAQGLAAIITDVLDLSKIEAGKLDLEHTRFDVQKLLRSLRLGYTMLADARQLSLQLEIEPGLGGLLRGDPTRVRQILSNFLSNALKFTPSGGVQLRARRIEASERVRFEVQDSGPGIDAQTQARLFKPFTQADESITRRFGGTGLGLAICRELAGLMGGEVGVRSQVGQGSVFWAELPLPAAEGAQDLAEAGSGTAEAQAQGAGGDDRERATPVSLHGRHVLLAEDNPVNMLIANAMLEQWGMKVTQAGDGQEAVQAVAEAEARGEPVEVVLMDVQMPEMSGYDATRALRQRHPRESLPVIALTAAALVSEREEALAAGMNDFLTKPIDADKLRETLARWLVGR